MSLLTPHQRTVLSYIREFQLKRGYSPSLADLALAFGVRSKNAVAKVIAILVREGHIEKDPKGRIKIIDLKDRDDQPAPLMLPLFGPISAGYGGDAEEHAEELITLDTLLVSNKKKTFLLRVKGDSMADAGIFEGDLVVVEKGREPKVNDIVVGIIDSAFTLKRLKKNKGKFYLQAENPAYPDLHPLEELQVAGIVRGSIRKY